MYVPSVSDEFGLNKLCDAIKRDEGWANSIKTGQIPMAPVAKSEDPVHYPLSR